MTGLPAFDRVHGQMFYSYLDLHPDAATAFDRGMTAYSELETAAILGAYDFGSSSNVVDVGGGQGALLMAVLKAYPRARGVLFDQETVVERVRDVRVRAEVAARCTIEQGSFFDSIPVGGDVYILKSILHNWDDERSLAILKNCRGAMTFRFTAPWPTAARACRRRWSRTYRFADDGRFVPRLPTSRARARIRLRAGRRSR